MPTQSLYCWQELSPQDDRWGTIVAVIPFLPEFGPTLLCARDREAMEKLGSIAVQHQQRTGHRVRLARYDYARTLAEIG